MGTCLQGLFKSIKAWFDTQGTPHKLFDVVPATYYVVGPGPSGAPAADSEASDTAGDTDAEAEAEAAAEAEEEAAVEVEGRGNAEGAAGDDDDGSGGATPDAGGTSAGAGAGAGAGAETFASLAVSSDVMAAVPAHLRVRHGQRSGVTVSYQRPHRTRTPSSLACHAADRATRVSLSSRGTTSRCRRLGLATAAAALRCAA